MVTFTPWLLYPQGDHFLYPLGRLGGPHSRHGRHEEQIYVNFIIPYAIHCLLACIFTTQCRVVQCLCFPVQYNVLCHGVYTLCEVLNKFFVGTPRDPSLYVYFEHRCFKEKKYTEEKHNRTTQIQFQTLRLLL
jgi:hypothetical protein